MRFTRRQRENLAKFLFDPAKLVLAINVLGPIVVPKRSPLVVIIVGFGIVIILTIFGISLDRGGEE